MSGLILPIKKHAPMLGLLAVVALLGIIAMPREEYTGDPGVVRCETVSLINHGTLAVPASVALGLEDGRGEYFFQNPTDHQYYSKYGILSGLIYVPSLLAEKWCEGRLPYFSHVRVFYLNWFNLLLALACAAYLFRIALRYTRSNLVAAGFVLAAFYCTFWWNYLRAQNSEIYQTLFFLGCYHHLTAYFSSARKRDLLLAGFWIGALVLVKAVFVVLIPAILLFVAAVEFKRAGVRLASLWPVLLLAVPLGGAFCLLLAGNALKYGSPLETGWSQGDPMFTGNILSGLYGFLLEPRHSIFIYFPILTIGLFGYPAFIRRHAVDACLFLSVGLLMLLISSRVGDWGGGWAYGPRYLLPYLPLLSLPFICTIELIWRHWRTWQGAAAGIAVAFVLAWSCETQVKVNSLPFFAYYRLQNAFKTFGVAAVDRYFDQRTFGGLAGDLLAYKRGKPWPMLALAAPALNAEGVARLTQIVHWYTVSNYYFWPDPANWTQPPGA